MKMRKLKWDEVLEVYKEYRDVINPIEVVDFETAIERCKQEVCKKYVKYNRDQMRKYRKEHPEYVEKERENAPKYYTGESRKFVAVVNKKYGSLSMYHYSKLSK